ncbi:MAG: hypothetical protein EXS63_04395 [Candidatus Omnitrophica bacterium]|nr:hypothetical protein [Candidatus Omnitrophota bacterium]
MLKKIKTSISFRIILVSSALMCLAAIYKEADPVGDTQTNPIAYKDKTEEIKQGAKEAPKPSFKLIEKEKFMIDSNLEKEKTENRSEETQSLLGADVPEDVLDASETQDLSVQKGEASQPQGQGQDQEQDQEQDQDQNTEEKSGGEDEKSGDDWWNTEDTPETQSDGLSAQNSFKN